MAYNPKSDKPFAAGDPGLVPAQETPDGSFLKDDGTWDSPIGTTDEKAGVSVDDTTPGYLDDKVSVGSGLKKTITSPAGNEGLEVAVDTSGVATEYMNGTGAFSTPPNDDTTYSAFTASVDGLVPSPTTATGKFLKDDGTWDVAASGSDGNDSVAITANDTTPDYLDSKVTTDGVIVKSVISPAGDEGLYLAVKSDGAATSYLNESGAYSTPPDTNTTYPVFSVGTDGLVDAPASSTGLFLKDDNTWDTPTDTDTTYSAFTDTVDGLVPAPTTPTGNFLKDDGTWAAASGGTSSGTYDIEKTTSDSTGILKKGTVNFLHDFSHPSGDTAIPVGQNVFLGEEAGNFTMGSTATSNQHGSWNIGIGYRAIRDLTIGQNNVGIGYRAGQNINTGVHNVHLGSDAAAGCQSGKYNFAVMPGSLDASLDGDHCIAIGQNSLADSTEDSNIGIGREAGSRFDTGEWNIFIGDAAGLSSLGGSLTSAQGSIFIGRNTYALTTTPSNEIVIGTDAVGNGDNTTTIGNSSTTDTYIEGTLHATLDNPDNDGLVLVGSDPPAFSYPPVLYAFDYDLTDGSISGGVSSAPNTKYMFYRSASCTTSGQILRALTLPTSATLGDEVHLYNYNNHTSLTGINVAAGSGDSILNYGGSWACTTGQYKFVKFIKITATEWMEFDRG